MISEKAYAKINLALGVGETDNDGYHELKTIMAPVDLYDILTFKEIDSNIILLDNTSLKYNENIVYRAAKLFLSTYKINKGVLITLEKNIPTEAGLGGGSADTAATFRGLNRLFNLDRPLYELAELSVALGSDIAYCIYDHLAYCTGRGTKVKLLDITYPKWNVLLIKPPFGCSTREIYHNYTVNNEDKDSKIDNVINALENGDLNSLNENMFNDLEKPAFIVRPELKNIHDKINEYSKAMMSGSGSTIFVICENEEKMVEIKENISSYLVVYQTKLL